MPAKWNKHFLSKIKIRSFLNVFYTIYGDYSKARTVVILTGRPSYLEELVISKKVNWSTPSPALCCAAHPAWPSCLCWAAQLPRLQDHAGRLVATGEPTGCSHCIPAIATPSCSCLYPKVQQEVLTWASFLFDSRNDEWSCSLVRKSYSNLNDQNVFTLSTVGVCMVCCVWIGGLFKAAQLRVPSI